MIAILDAVDGQRAHHGYPEISQKASLRWLLDVMPSGPDSSTDLSRVDQLLVFTRLHSELTNPRILAMSVSTDSD
jgi:hypothetical protein